MEFQTRGIEAVRLSNNEDWGSAAEAARTSTCRCNELPLVADLCLEARRAAGTAAHRSPGVTCSHRKSPPGAAILSRSKAEAGQGLYPIASRLPEQRLFQEQGPTLWPIASRLPEQRLFKSKAEAGQGLHGVSA